MVFARWQELVHDPGAARHVVHLHRDPRFLAAAVSAWCAPALRSDGGALLIGTPAHTRAIVDALRKHHVDARALMAAGRLAVVDAHAALAECAPRGSVDVRALHRHVHPALTRVRAACAEGAELRAWGELVDLVRARGDAEGARRLEALWNESLAEDTFRLLCSYRVDNLSDDAHAGTVREVCDGHDHLIPEEDDQGFEAAVSRALVHVFGEEEAWAMRRALEARVPVDTVMPSGEAVLLALHAAHPELGARVLRAVREDRRTPLRA